MRSCHGVSSTSLFLELFCREFFEYLLNSTNQSAKPTDLKMIFLAFSLLVFLFDILYFRGNVLINVYGGVSFSPGKNALKCV